MEDPRPSRQEFNYWFIGIGPGEADAPNRTLSNLSRLFNDPDSDRSQRRQFLREAPEEDLVWILKRGGAGALYLANLLTHPKLTDYVVPHLLVDAVQVRRDDAASQPATDPS